MPIYEYQCQKCNTCFEKLQLPGRDDTDPQCPQCGAREAKRLMSCASFMGSGIGGLCTKGVGSGFS